MNDKDNIRAPADGPPADGAKTNDAPVDRAASDRAPPAVPQQEAPQPAAEPEQKVENNPSVATDADTQLLLKGSLWSALGSLAWPLFVTMIATSFAGFADAYVAGRISPAAQAAIGIGDVVWFFVLLLASALATGTEALVSRHWGAGEKEQAVRVGRQALILAACIGAISTLVGLFFCKPLFSLVGAAPDVQDSGWTYLRFNLSAVMPFTLIWTTNGIFRALGRTRVQMLAMTLVSGLVVLLDYLLCIHPFHFGISGIGIAWSFAGVLGALVFLWRLRKSEMRDCVSWKEMRKQGFEHKTIWRLLRVSGPACLQDIATVGANFFLLLILSHTAEATPAQAAWAIGMKVQEMLALVPLLAIANAVSPIVGQNLGAKQPQRAARAGWMFAAMDAAVGYVFACTFMLAAHPIAAFMTTDPAVVEQAALFLQMLGIAAPITAISLVLSNAMDGSGYTRIPTTISAGSLLLVELPVAYLLACTLGLGPLGAWIGMLVSTIVVASSMLWLFYRGKWQNQKV